MRPVTVDERGANVDGDLTTGHTSVDPAVPGVGETPLDAVVPFRRDGEIVPQWEATLPGFVRSLFLSCSAGTCRTYLEALARFIQEAGDPLEVDAAAVEEFLSRPLAGRQGRTPGPRSASSRTVELAAIRRYYRWAHREGVRPGDPTTRRLYEACGDILPAELETEYYRQNTALTEAGQTT